MTVEATYKDGHFVPQEQVSIAEGTRGQLSFIPERSEAERKEALDRLMTNMAEAAKEANPNFVWSRDLAYEFDDEE